VGLAASSRATASLRVSGVVATARREGSLSTRHDAAPVTMQRGAKKVKTMSIANKPSRYLKPILFSRLLTIGIQTANSGELRQSVSLYAWLPAVSGELSFPPPGSGGGDLTVDASDILDNLEMVFMGTYTLQNDRFVFLADAVYLDLANTKTVGISDNESVSASLQLQGFQTSLYGGYRFSQGDKAPIDFIAGVRYLTLEIDGQFDGVLQDSSRTTRENIWDAIVGIKGQYNITHSWFIPYLGDIGAGGSELTYQLYGGIGFGGKWGDVVLAYRHLEWVEGGGAVSGLAFSGGMQSYRYNF